MMADVFRARKYLNGTLTDAVTGNSRSSRFSVVLTLFASLAALPGLAAAQSAPNPPDPFCVEASGCGSSGGGGSPEAKKWNPGHYMKPQGNHAQSDQSKYYSSVTSQLAKVDDSSEIRGALIGYAWGALEPSNGNYDWGPVYTHLNYLEARGKKLIVSVLIKCFGTDCGRLAPSDLTSEVYVTARQSPTSIVSVWKTENMDRYIRFMEAFAAEFDGHPALEMVLGAESTPSLGGETPANYSKGAYADQLKRMYSAQAEAFRSTNVIANVNFLGGEVSGLIEHAYQVGAGRGLPDLFDSNGSLVFRGECAGSDCGVRDYRGMIPHLGVISTPTLTGKHDTAVDSPDEIISYGLTNKLTHYAWVTNEGGEDSWSNIISAIESTNPDGHTACPTAYERGCN